MGFCHCPHEQQGYSWAAAGSSPASWVWILANNKTLYTESFHGSTKGPPGKTSLWSWQAGQLLGDSRVPTGLTGVTAELFPSPLQPSVPSQLFRPPITVRVPQGPRHSPSHQSCSCLHPAVVPRQRLRQRLQQPGKCQGKEGAVWGQTGGSSSAPHPHQLPWERRRWPPAQSRSLVALGDVQPLTLLEPKSCWWW